MISIVVPIYNERECLPLLRARLTAAAPLWKEDFEVVLIDDGSSDGSFEMMAEMASADPRFKVIRLSRNFGHQGAISAGIEHATGDVVAIMDGDLQDPPESLPLFLEKWRAGYQVVYAIRTKRKEGLVKRAFYKLFYRGLSAISDIRIPLDSGDFCLMDRQVVDALKNDLPERVRFVRGLRAYLGFRQIGVEYERDARAAGEIKYTFRKLIGLAGDGVFGFSTLPLRLATYLGLFISGVSFLVGTFFIVHRVVGFKVFGHSPEDTPGMASLTVGIYFLGGIILLFIGLLGEYIGRIYTEVKQRPPFVVASRIGFSDASPRRPT